LSRRLFRRAGGQTEDSRRAHTDKKYAFEARIAIHKRAIHRFGRRKKFERFHASTYTHLLVSRIHEIRARNSLAGSARRRRLPRLRDSAAALPSMICGMIFLHRDKNSATNGA